MSEILNMEDVFLITNRVMNLSEQDFTGIFDWLGDEEMNHIDKWDERLLMKKAQKPGLDDDWY